MSALSTPLIQQRSANGVPLSRKLMGGVSALGTATALERGLSFLANLSAARLGGASTFGAYSLALTTANNIASYAGAGIGSTATRFSGAYISDEAGRRALGKALLLVAVSSAGLAAALLLGGAAPLARLLLHQPALAPLLRWAALPAAAIILLECFRGFLVGQRRFAGQIGLSALVGIGYLLVLPFLSRWGAAAMVCGFAAVAGLSVSLVMIWLSFDGKPAPVAASAWHSENASSLGVVALTREVWKFGLVQLAGVVGLNAAGLWIASLIVRSDASMVEMGLFAAANQVRNMAGMAPALFTQTSYGLMADGSHEPGHVVGVSSAAAALASVVLAGVGIAVLPWAMPLAYGRAFHAAVLAGCLALATSIVHLSNGPAAARLTIVSLRRTTIINTFWALIVFALGTLLFARADWAAKAAAGAMATYLIAHLVSAVLVALSLRRMASLPQGMLTLLAIPSSGAIVMALLAAAREAASDSQTRAVLTIAILASTALVTWGITRQSRRFGWAPHLPARLRFWERAR